MFFSGMEMGVAVAMATITHTKNISLVYDTSPPKYYRHPAPCTRESQYFTYFAPTIFRAMLSVQKRITSILIDKLGINESEITPDASFVKDLGIDSLDYAELVMEFEQTFDIKIPDDDAEKMQTIGQAVSYIESKLKS